MMLRVGNIHLKNKIHSYEKKTCLSEVAIYQY